MTPWAEWGQINQQPVVLGLAEPKWRLVINLQGDMGAKAELRILGKGPILHEQLQSPLISSQESAVGWINQLQPGLMASKGRLQLLNSTGRAHFLKASRGRAWTDDIS
jgi:hypothetical protein